MYSSKVRSLISTLIFSIICLGLSAQAKIVLYPEVPTGPVKLMNAANNGPIPDNLDAYQALRVPYARTHDTALGEAYGRHCVDISILFPDFKANVNNPRSYDFTVTDSVLTRMVSAGTKPFFRLGQSIEHQEKKYGIYPPSSYKKWAKICEHVIRHYNEGWADGFHFGIEYWEIWNEPDLDADGRWKTDPRTWAGTQDEFNKMYVVASRHLKSCFPELKIGGPAFANPRKYGPEFLEYVKRNDAPLDFFSWHMYHRKPYRIGEDIRFVREMLDEKGFGQTESILNEWNYVRSWSETDFYSARVRQSLKAAAFVASVMCVGQQNPVDMLMYYDLRPNTSWNGAFKAFVYDKLPAYYSLYAWASLAEMSQVVKVDCDLPDVDCCCASDGKSNLRLLLSRYNEDDSVEGSSNMDICIPQGYSVSRVRLLDSSHPFEEIPYICPSTGVLTLSMETNSVAFIEFVKD